MNWEKQFAREQPLLNECLINEGYTTRAKKELGWGFKNTAFNIRRGYVTSYRGASDMRSLGRFIRKRFATEGAIAGACDKIGMYAQEVRAATETVSGENLNAKSNSQLLELFQDACKTYEQMWSVYTLSVYFEQFLTGRLTANAVKSIIDLREEIGGTERNKKALVYADFERRALGAFAKEVERRTGIDRKLALCATPEEITALLGEGTPLDKSGLRERYEHCILVTKNCTTSLLVGSAAREFEQRELREPADVATDEITGTTACAGLATGPAKIILRMTDLGKISPGDVMITPMTIASYIPAMRKCAAIVTDEGGVTCHAAIVSREMGVPCIVGTKNATHVFRNGQQLEVNAETGTISTAKAAIRT